MALYVAIFREPIAPEAAADAKRNPLIQDTYVLTDHALAVDGQGITPTVISEVIGMSGNAEHPRSGIVFKLNGSY